MLNSGLGLPTRNQGLKAQALTKQDSLAARPLSTMWVVTRTLERPGDPRRELLEPVELDGPLTVNGLYRNLQAQGHNASN